MKTTKLNLFTKVWAILLVFITFNSFALETPNTAKPIYGTPPSAIFTGMNILDSSSVIVNEGDILSAGNSPSDYTLDYSALAIDTWDDADGDEPDSVAPFTVNVTPIPEIKWIYNGNALTAAELTQSFSGLGLEGKSIIIEALVSVTIKSATGQPNTNTTFAKLTRNVTIGGVSDFYAVKFVSTMSAQGGVMLKMSDMPNSWPNVAMPLTRTQSDLYLGSGMASHFFFVVNAADSYRPAYNNTVSLLNYNPTLGYTWKSSNPAVATVNNAGGVALKGPGTVTITATKGSTTLKRTFSISKWLNLYYANSSDFYSTSSTTSNPTAVNSNDALNNSCNNYSGYRLAAVNDFTPATTLGTNPPSVVNDTSIMESVGGTNYYYYSFTTPVANSTNLLENWGFMYTFASLYSTPYLYPDVPAYPYPTLAYLKAIWSGQVNGGYVHVTSKNTAICSKPTSDKNNAKITSIQMKVNNSSANGVTANIAEVFVSDNYVGQSGITVNWSISGSSTAVLSSGSSVTNSSGKAQINITDTIPETFQITASMTNGYSTSSSMSANVTFAGDLSTARIATMDIVRNYSLANGSTTNRVKIKVTDNTGTAFVGYNNINWNLSGSAVKTASTSTDSNGEAWIEFKDLVAEPVIVTATLPATSSVKSVQTAFSGNTSTAKINTLVVIKDNSPVRAKLNPNKVKIHVVDASGKNIPNYPISWTFLGLSNPSATNLVMSNPKTDDNGEAIVAFTNYAQQQVKVTAKLITTSATDSVVTTFSQALLKIKYAIPLFNTSVKHDLDGAGSTYPTTGFYGAAFRLQVTDYTVGQTTYFSVSDPNIAYFSNTISADTREVTLRKKDTFVVTAGNDVDGYANRTFSIPKWITPQGDRKSGVPAGCTLANLSDLTSSTAINSPPADLGIGIGNLMAEYGYVNDYNYYPYAIYGFHPYMTHLTAAGTYKWVHTDLNNAKANYGSEINLFVSGVTTPLAAEKYACLY